MNLEALHQLRKSFARVESMEQVATLIFYRRLFETAPETRRFLSANIEDQSRKLIENLQTALSLAQSPAEFQHTLARFGAKLMTHGARPEHYPVATLAMIEMLAAVLGTEFTPALRSLWARFLDSIAASMLVGAAHSAKRCADSPEA